MTWYCLRVSSLQEKGSVWRNKVNKQSYSHEAIVMWGNVIPSKMHKMYWLWTPWSRDCPTQLHVHACASVCVVCEGYSTLCILLSLWSFTLPAGDSTPSEPNIQTDCSHAFALFPTTPTCNLYSHWLSVVLNPGLRGWFSQQIQCSHTSREGFCFKCEMHWEASHRVACCQCVSWPPTERNLEIHHPFGARSGHSGPCSQIPFLELPYVPGSISITHFNGLTLSSPSSPASSTQKEFCLLILS